MKTRDPIARALRTPKFRPRTTRDRSKYRRKVKHKKGEAP
jgi:hypothetical protein